jgi:prepilin peptidase CpaA
MILFGLFASLTVHAWLDGVVAGAGNWLAGAMTGFALLIPLYLVRGTSAGDVKLLLMIGSWVGPEMVLAITLATFVIGGAWSIAFAVLRRRTLQLLLNLQTLFRQGLRPMGTAGPGVQPQIVSIGSLPYGVAIAAGTLGVLFAAAT